MNRIGGIYGEIAAQALGADGITSITAQLDVETASVRLSAPPVGQVGVIPHQPLVEDSLELVAPDGSQYIEGTDYQETQTGFLNLLIPAGESLLVDYFYYTEGPIAPSIPANPLPEESHLPPVEQAPPVADSGSGMKYSTMLKMGMS